MENDSTCARSGQGRQRRAGGLGVEACAIAVLLSAGAAPAGPVFAALGSFPPLPAMDAVPDARSLGMGRAFTAIAEGPAAAWWNPGGLGLPARWSAQIYTDLGRTPLYYDGELRSFAASGSLGEVGIGAVWSHFDETLSGDAAGVESDSHFLLGAGTDLAHRIAPGSQTRWRWGAGAGARYYRFTMRDDRDVPVYREHGEAFDLDAGSLLALRFPLEAGGAGGAEAGGAVGGAGAGGAGGGVGGVGGAGDLFEPGGEAGPWLGLRTGVVLHNILDQKLDMTIGPDGETPIGQKIRAGAAIEAASASWAGFGPIVSGTVAAEFESDMGDFRANPVRCYGAEIRVLDLLSFRYGRVEDDAWDFEGVTRGAGVQVAIPGRGGVRLDWASVPLPLHGTDTEQTTVSVWMQPWR